MRKTALFSLAIALVLAMVGMASAAQNVVGTNQKGSLLVWPKIEAFDSTVDTYILIGNDNSLVPAFGSVLASAFVYVKCYWMDSNQTVEDFQFPLSPFQPFYFSAMTGHGDYDDIQVPPFVGVGSLVCFAEDAGDQTQVPYNHLYGSALIVYPAGSDPVTAVSYNAYSFRWEGAGAGANPGKLPLSGDTGYDACPAYLVENFLASDGLASGTVLGTFERPDLTLWPCKQDLRQDRQPTCTKAKFDVWNENEVKFTGAYQCFKCFYEGFLDEIGSTNMQNGFSSDTTQKGNGFGWDKFLEHTLGTEVGRFRVSGVTSSACTFRAPWTACNGKTVNTPLLGVLMYANGAPGYYGPGNAKLPISITGQTLHGPATSGDTTGLIQWDPAGSTPEVVKK